MNLVEQVEERAEVENKDEVGVEGADPYSFTSNEIQDDENGEPLGRSLVIQRLLLTLRRELNDQRQVIFHARCTINKRVCDLIIDSSSMESIASKSLVTKLGLKTKKHRSPYKIDWIKKGTKTLITYQC